MSDKYFVLYAALGELWWSFYSKSFSCTYIIGVLTFSRMVFLHFLVTHFCCSRYNREVVSNNMEGYEIRLVDKLHLFLGFPDPFHKYLKCFYLPSSTYCRNLENRILPIIIIIINRRVSKIPDTQQTLVWNLYKDQCH